MDEGTLKIPILNVVFSGHFCLGWCSSLVGSESGQKQSVKLLQNMVCNTTQHPFPHHHTRSVYNNIYFGNWVGGDAIEKLEGHQYISMDPSSMGAKVHKLGRKYQT
jgi:hypothetical protein